MMSVSTNRVVAGSKFAAVVRRYFILLILLFGMSTTYFNHQMLQANRHHTTSEANFGVTIMHDLNQFKTDNYKEKSSKNETSAIITSVTKTGKKELRGRNFHESSETREKFKKDIGRELKETEHAKQGKLSCAAYEGGPSDELAQEMVYWKDIPLDALYRSPFHPNQQSIERDDAKEQFLTFAPDHGGSNNLRMRFETMISLSVAMGRTLVLPPETKYPVSHYFDFTELNNKYAGARIITMQEYLQSKAVQQGNLFDATLLSNRTNWDGNSEELFEVLRNVTTNVHWNTKKCLTAFPSSKSDRDIRFLLELTKIVSDLPLINDRRIRWEDYVGNPVPVNGSALERLKEHWMNRERLCVYDNYLQSIPVLHYPCCDDETTRLQLLHFYAILFHQDWQQGLWVKRFVRDNLHYPAEIQCAAARVVAKIRHLILERNIHPSLPPEAADAFRYKNGTMMEQAISKFAFDTMHIRRSDFKAYYKGTFLDAKDLVERAKRLIPVNGTIFIATDERNKTFFDPFIEYYNVYFLDDFMDLVESIKPMHLGFVDQLIASRGRVFLGCWFSTFTGFINRMRGYHSDKDRIPGHEQGVIPSWYYAPEDKYDQMRQYYAIKQPAWSREFPTGWRQIDTGLKDFHKSFISYLNGEYEARNQDI